MTTLEDPQTRSVSPPPPVGGLAAEAMRSRIAARVFGEGAAPTRVGRFEIRDELGSGGMGIVYSATDPSLHRLVAVKVLSADHVGDDQHRERLVREARALARLSHPNVVSVHEVGEHKDGIFVVMEHVEGMSLEQWQKDRSRPLPEILGVYLQAAQGLHAAHQAGLVHRDFKPSNVLVGDDGRVRVADFGLARLGEPVFSVQGGDTTSGSGAESTRSVIMGTPAYMSPEQAAGRPTDSRTDQFSFCVALWEATFGVRPWEPPEIRAMSSDAGSIPAPAVRRDGPRWLRRILLRGLSPNADERWPDVAALRLALERGLYRRRRFAWALIVISVGAVGLAAADGFERPCEDPSAALSGIWDDARRGALDDHVAAAPAAFERDALPSIRGRLDRYAATWLAARRDSCEATYLRAEQSEEQFDRSIACLERVRHALGAGVDTLVSATPEVMSQAESLLDQLPRIEACRDVRVLRDGPVPPSDDIAEEVEQVQRSIDRAGVLAAAGRIEDALALGTAARDRAIELDHPPTIAEATFVVGQSLALQGDHEEARRILFDAATQALGARAYERAVHAWHRLVSLATTDLESAQQARNWQALAASALQLLGPSTVLEAEHLDHDGLVAKAAGDYEHAAECHRRAAEQLAQTVPWDDLRVVQIERRAANALLALGRLDEAERLYLALAERVVGRFGSRHPEYARLSHNLALVAQSRGDHELARERYQQSVDILAEAFGPRSLRVAPAMTALGQLAASTRDFELALDLGTKAWRIQRERLPVGHSDRGIALLLLAEVNRTRGAHEGALAQYEELAQEFAQGAHVDHLPEIHQNIAWLLCELDRCTEARSANERARDLAPADQPIGIYIDTTTARIELTAGEVAAAIARLEALAPEAEELPAESHPELLPEIRWLLARALALRGAPKDHQRARLLAEQSREGYVQLGTRPESIERIDVLLRSLRPGK